MERNNSARYIPSANGARGEHLKECDQSSFISFSTKKFKSNSITCG